MWGTQEGIFESLQLCGVGQQRVVAPHAGVEAGGTPAPACAFPLFRALLLNAAQLHSIDGAGLLCCTAWLAICRSSVVLLCLECHRL